MSLGLLNRRMHLNGAWIDSVVSTAVDYYSVLNKDTHQVQNEGFCAMPLFVELAIQFNSNYL